MALDPVEMMWVELLDRGWLPTIRPVNTSRTNQSDGGAAYVQIKDIVEWAHKSRRRGFSDITHQNVTWLFGPSASVSGSRVRLGSAAKRFGAGKFRISAPRANSGTRGRNINAIGTATAIGSSTRGYPASVQAVTSSNASAPRRLSRHT